MGNGFSHWRNPHLVPEFNVEPTFDPHYGFNGKRKERVMHAKQEELVSAKIPLADRDYCAHLLLKYQSCRADTFPFVYKCHHEKHAYATCEFEDYVLRMKEYERERRLRERGHRPEQSLAA